MYAKICIVLQLFTITNLHIVLYALMYNVSIRCKKKLHCKWQNKGFKLRVHSLTIFIKFCIVYNRFYNKIQFVAVLICMRSDDCGSHRIPSTSSSIKRQIYTHMSKHDSHDPTLYSSRVKKLRDSNLISIFLYFLIKFVQIEILSAEPIN